MTNTLEVSPPKWNSEEAAYYFHFQSAPTLEGTAVPNAVSLNLPDLSKHPMLDELLMGFFEKTKQFFVTPLVLEKVKKHLHHYISDQVPFPTEDGFYKPVWIPAFLKMKSNEFGLYWCVSKWVPSTPLIRSDFFRSQTPTPPEQKPNLRTIHIQNTLDTLVPVGDLPLSDLPPLNFGEETSEQKEVRRRIREARLKVELAKLKAKRMEQKYYERYGEAALESDESSLESSESDSDGPVGKYSYP